MRLNDEQNKRKFGVKKQISIRGFESMERSDYDSDSGSRLVKSRGSSSKHRFVENTTDTLSGRRASSAEAALRSKTLSKRSLGCELKS